MDNSSVFTKMIDGAIELFPEQFKVFDRTKNVQDQIQEMLKLNATGAMTKLMSKPILYVFALDNFCRDGLGAPCDYPNQFTSMEQLWLAALMYWKYNKRWNGKAWDGDKWNE